MCRINPRIDFAFKKLFGSENNKDLLISLINSIVNLDEKIVHVQLRNPYNLADYQQGKMSILDIKAEDEKGYLYNVEMQIGEDLYYDKRAIYYWSKLVTEQLSEGMMFKQLNKTISINIMDFNIVNNNSAYHNKYKILNEKTGHNDELHDMFELHYIELKKFRKKYSEISSSLDRWIMFLTKAHELNKRNLPIELSNDIEIIKAISEVDRMFDEEERAMYNVRLQVQMEFESKLDSAIEKGLKRGIERGIKQGLEQGLERGLEQGLEQGIEKGIEQEKIILAQKSLQQGLDNKTISQITGLSILEIEKLNK